MSRLAYKTDASFLEKIALGAMAARKTLDFLNSKGHRMIELERLSLSDDLWKDVKLKRRRVPDLLCIKCGLRVESRAKSKLEITVSHSQDVKDREWDAGLLDEDWMAFLLCTKTGKGPRDWAPSECINFVKIGSMRIAESTTKLKQRKGAEEGSEVQKTWPFRVPHKSGIITAIDGNTVKLAAVDGKISTIRLALKGAGRLVPQVKVGDAVRAEEQFVAAVVPLVTPVTCPGGKNAAGFAKDLMAKEFTVRFAAAKALGEIGDTTTCEALKKTLGAEKDDLVIMEAAGSLAKLGSNDGFEHLKKVISGGDSEQKFRTAVILSEISSEQAEDMLATLVSDTGLHPEIRAVAAKGLQLRTGLKGQTLRALIEATTSDDFKIRLHAARSLVAQQETVVGLLLQSLPGRNDLSSATICWCLARIGQPAIADILDASLKDDKREWCALTLGLMYSHIPQESLAELKRRSPEIGFAARVLSRIQGWIYELDSA